MLNRRANRLRIIGMGLFIAGLSLWIQLSSAQPSSCKALVQAAFADLSKNCSAASGNSVCFGHSTRVVPDTNNFSQPGDVVDIANLESVTTLPLNEETEQWGLAALNVQANVPLALSEKGLRYFLIGDIGIENAVSTDDAFTPAESIIVAPLVGANLRSRPTTESQVVANAPIGTELSVDGRSPDGAWLRVLHENEIAWISRQIVGEKSGNIDSLPVIGPDSRTLMQSFFLRAGADSPDCTDAPPSLLIVQSPSGLNASITVNEVTIRLNSTIALRILSPNILQAITLSGGTNVDGVSVPPGFAVNIPLADDGRAAAGAATGLAPITDEQRQFLSLVAGYLAPELLYEPIRIPSQAEVNAILAQVSGGGGQAAAGPAAGQADCSRFKPTSPLGSLALGTTAFYWDAAQGATSYRLSVYGPDGGLRVSIDTSNQSTTYTLDTGSVIGEGTNFAWEVQAIVNGQVACTSARISLPRDAFSQQVSGGNNGPQVTPTACTWSC